MQLICDLSRVNSGHNAIICVLFCVLSHRLASVLDTVGGLGCTLGADAALSDTHRHVHTRSLTCYCWLRLSPHSGQTEPLSRQAIKALGARFGLSREVECTIIWELSTFCLLDCFRRPQLYGRTSILFLLSLVFFFTGMDCLRERLLPMWFDYALNPLTLSWAAQGRGEGSFRGALPLMFKSTRLQTTGAATHPMP